MSGNPNASGNQPGLPQFGAPQQPPSATPVNPANPVNVVEPTPAGAQSGLVLQPVGGGIEQHWERERLNQ